MAEAEFCCCRSFVAQNASICCERNKINADTVIVLYSQAREVKPQHANATRLHGNVTLLLNIYIATVEIPTLLSPSSPAKATKDGGVFPIPPSCNMVVFKLLSLESIFVTTPNLRQDIYIFAQLINCETTTDLLWLDYTSVISFASLLLYCPCDGVCMKSIQHKIYCPIMFRHMLSKPGSLPGVHIIIILYMVIREGGKRNQL